MTDVVIRATDLRKVYRLYTNPSYRFRDMFGLLRQSTGAYTEHAALADVTFEVRRGEKVAFIGRNGAGKSTLLKLVTRVIEPTSGTIEVGGKVQALLQIGSGFHPDFTGRQNVYAYFAQLGVTGKLAAQKCAEVIEFAELEEYIDQPIKTYSTGMAVRLMFSASTAITPDLLILDEVLGVGDAYFAHKSYERIRELCDQEGTTLLLVSHDIYAAAKICNRMIWLDQGRVMVDLPPADALRLYEDSVKIQEEQRLRKKVTTVGQPVVAAAEGQRDAFLVEIAVPRPPAVDSTHFARMALYANGVLIAEAPLGAAPASDGASLVLEGSAWGETAEWNGRLSRSMLHYGNPFHKVAVLFRARGLEAAVTAKSLALEIEYGAPVPMMLELRGFLNGSSVSLGALPPSAGAWASHRVVATPANEVLRQASASAGVGTGAIVVKRGRLIDEDERDVFVVQHGRPVRLEIDYEIADPALTGPLDVGVAIMRNGVETTCRFFSRDLRFDSRQAPRGTVVLSLPENWLGTGTYTVTTMFAREGYADQPAHVFYSISPDVYASVRDLLEFEVRGGNLFATGTPILARGHWTTRVRA